MRLPHNVNPVHVSSKDSTRYVLNSVSLQGNLAVATNGRALFATRGQREETDDPRDATIPKRAAKAAWPQNRRKSGFVLPSLTINPVAEDGNKTVTVMSRDYDTTQFGEIDGTFPNIESVIPDAAKHSLALGINVTLLVEIAKAFGKPELVLHLDPDGWKESDCGYCPPIIITQTQNPESVAILMPIRAAELTGMLGYNLALREVTERKERRAEAERAAAEAKAEADRTAAAEWMSANSQPQPPTE